MKVSPLMATRWPRPTPASSRFSVTRISVEPCSVLAQPEHTSCQSCAVTVTSPRNVECTTGRPVHASFTREMAAQSPTPVTVTSNVSSKPVL